MIDWNETQLWKNLGIVVSSVILCYVSAKRKQQQWSVAPGRLPFFGHALSMANSDDGVEQEFQEEMLPIVVIGAGLSGLQFTSRHSSLSSSNTKNPIVLLEMEDRPGGKALGIYDDIDQDYSSSYGYYCGKLSHRYVTKIAYKCGLADFVHDKPIRLSATVSSFPDKERPKNVQTTNKKYRTKDEDAPGMKEANGSSLEFDRKMNQRDYESVGRLYYNSGHIQLPLDLLALRWIKAKLTAGYGEASPELWSKLMATNETGAHKFMKAGGYGYMPQSYFTFRSAFDLKTLKRVKTGQTEMLAARIVERFPNDKVTLHCSARVDLLEFGAGGDVKGVVWTDIKTGQQHQTLCEKVVCTLPVNQAHDLFQRSLRVCQAKGLDMDGLTQATELLRGAEFHRYRGWIVEVEQAKAQGCHVMNFDMSYKPGAVAGFVKSDKVTKDGKDNVMQFLQIGVNGPIGVGDHPDDFYLDEIKKVCSQCGMGKVLRVRGNAVWPMATYFPDRHVEVHQKLEELQGSSNVYFCGDYMFAASMATSMPYAAKLAKSMLSASIKKSFG